MGPTNRTLSISPSVEKPEYRNISKFVRQPQNKIILWLASTLLRILGMDLVL